MGEMLRRYWQPVCTADELGDLPKRVRIMCEDLAVFRDGAGNTLAHRTARARREAEGGGPDGGAAGLALPDADFPITFRASKNGSVCG